MKDYRPIYQSKSGRIPQSLDSSVFVNKAIPQILPKEDLPFVEGLKEVINSFSIPYKGTYFIVDIGHAHLPLVGLELMSQGIDPSFFIPGRANQRLEETLAYVAQKYKEEKEKLERVLGYATLIDEHRGDFRSTKDGLLPREGAYNLLSSAFPSSQTLHDLKIERIIYITEAAAKKKLSLEPIKPDLIKPILEYKKVGIPIESFGIDDRDRNKERSYFLSSDSNVPLRQRPNIPLDIKELIKKFIEEDIDQINKY